MFVKPIKDLVKKEKNNMKVGLGDGPNKLHLISCFFSPQEMVAEFLSSADAIPREKHSVLCRTAKEKRKECLREIITNRI